MDSRSVANNIEPFLERTTAVATRKAPYGIGCVGRLSSAIAVRVLSLETDITNWAALLPALDWRNHTISQVGTYLSGSTSRRLPVRSRNRTSSAESCAGPRSG